MKTLTIAARFCGPETSSNGGYFAGLVATLASRTLAVRLLKPPPLDTELAVRELADGALQVVQGEEPIGEARPALLERSEEHTSELQSRVDLVCRLLLEKT